MRTAKIEIWEAAPHDWRWHLKAANGEIVAQGEGYKTYGGVQSGVNAFTRAARTAHLVMRKKPKP